MKKHIIGFALIGCIAFSSCSTVNYMSTNKLKANYETKINHTTFLGKALFKTDKKKKDTYENVKVYMNENESVAVPTVTSVILLLPNRKCWKRLPN